MCEFASWKVYNKKVYFLKDLDLNTREGRKLLDKTVIADLCGHGAIESFYPELKGKGENKECTDFSSPDNFPLEIVEAIKDGKMTRFGIETVLLTESAWAEYLKIKQPAWAEYQKIQQSALAEYEKIEQPAWTEYKKIQQSAWAEYLKIKQPALAEYEKIKQPAWAEYQKIQQSAWAEYEKIEQSAWAEYEKIRQPAFWKLFANPKNRIEAWR